jgi:hypothetical protein
MIGYFYLSKNSITLLNLSAAPGMGIGPHCKKPVLHEDGKILLILNP